MESELEEAAEVRQERNGRESQTGTSRDKAEELWALQGHRVKCKAEPQRLCVLKEYVESCYDPLGTSEQVENIRTSFYQSPSWSK